MAHSRRWLKRLGLVLAALVGLLVVLVGGALIFLSTKTGGEKLRHLVESKANAAIEGRLAIGRLSLHGGHLVLHEVVLDDPDGREVARVDELEVRVSLLALLHKTIDLSLLRIERPVLHVVQDARGSNLERAIASRHPSPTQPSKGKGGFGFAIDSLRLDGGAIEVEQQSTRPERRLRLEGLRARGHARLDGDALEAKLSLGGAAREPFDGALAVSLDATEQGDVRHVAVNAGLGDARLVAHATLSGSGQAEVRLDTLTLPPELLAFFVPGCPLRVPIAAHGQLRKTGAHATVDLDATAANATASLEGSFDLATQRSDGVELRIQHLNLAELTAHGPASDVAIALHAEGGGTDLANATGRLALDVPTSKMEGQPMGPIRLRASASHGQLELGELSVQFPGVQLSAKGTASRAKVAISGTLVAQDLDAFARTLGRLGCPPLSVSGSGKLDFAATGPLADPAVRIDGGFPELRYQARRIAQLTVHAQLPQVKHPASAKVALRAKTFALDARRRFRDVRIDAKGDGKTLGLDASVHGFADLALTLTAVIDTDNHGAELKSFALRYPEASWRLIAPVRIAARGRALSIGRLELRADRQSIALEAKKRGRQLHARLAIDGLDLSRLPKALVDPALRLAGRVDLLATVDGSPRSPRVVAKVELRQGRLKKYSGLALHLNASYANAHAVGELAAKGAGARITGHFDVPVKALKTGGREPVRIEARLDQIALGPWLQNLGIEKPLRGLASANLSMSGTASAPRLSLDARLDRLQLRAAPPADLELTVKSAKNGTLAARVDLALAGKKSELELQTPLTLGELFRRPLRAAELLATPIQLDADLRELPLAAISQAGLSTQPLQGTLSAQARIRGAPRLLTGTASISVNGVARPGTLPVDGEAKLELGEALRASFFVARQNTVLVDANANIAATTGQLRQPEKLSSAPISLDARLGPVSLAEVQQLTRPADVDPAHQTPPLQGMLEGSLKASGSLRDPRLSVALKIGKLSVKHQAQTGDLSLSLLYAQAREALEVALRSSGGGSLEVKAESKVDLSLPALRERRDLSATPIAASLVAERFNPAFLSHLSAMVQKLGGELDGNGKLWGTIGAPRAEGQLEWKNGTLETNGYGDFHELHLLAQASNDRYELKDLSMKSGEGGAKLSGFAFRDGKRFKLHAVANLDKFPAMSDGELLATLSLNATADGNANGSHVFIRSLKIPEAHVQLPDVKKKDLQKLAPAKDIVLTVNGKPIKGQKLAEAAVSPLAQGVGGSGSAGIPSRFRAVVRVDAPRNVWIQGNDIDTEIGLSDGFRIEYSGTPALFGDVLLQRGRLEVFGRRFDWQKGSKVTFEGPVLEPDLDVTAVYKNETEEVTVYLKAEGQGDQVRLEPTSDPPLSDTEIYTLLATGHTTLHHGSGNTSPAGEAASLIGSFAAGQLKKTLSSVLPLDVFSIEAGDHGLEGTKVEAGTYVNDRLYLGFTGRVGADPMKGENSNEVDLDYQLSKHWSLEGSYGDAQAGGADLVWQKDY